MQTPVPGSVDLVDWNGLDGQYNKMDRSITPSLLRQDFLAYGQTIMDGR